MSKITLCIDTCGLYYSIAILKNEEILQEFVSYERHMQCEQFIVKVEELLEKCNISYVNIDAIAVTNGPGSFNGVRIGMSAAYGISLARNITIIRVSVMEVMLYKAIQKNIQYPIHICFLADNSTAFMQKFSHEQAFEIIELNVSELPYDCISFDLNNFNVCNSTISNAVAAGLISLTQEIQNDKLFYGKQPSITS